MVYRPGLPPTQTRTDPALLSYIQRELLTIARSFQEHEVLHVVPAHAPPRRLVEGLLVFADGSDWNPGQGRGFYVWTNGQWKMLAFVEAGAGDTLVIHFAAAAPTLADGNIGDWWIDSTNGDFFYKEEAGWVVRTRLVLAELNLAGLANTDTALSNLGLTPLGVALVKAATAAAQRTVLELGTAATAAIGDFAPASHPHTIADLPVAGSGVSSPTDLVRADDSRLSDPRTPIAHTHPSASITDFAEAVDDRVAALLVAGTNISFTYDDVANTLTIAATSSGGGSGDVVGPSGAVSGRFASFDGTTGKLIADSGFSSASFAPAAHVGAGGAAHADVVAGGASGFMTGVQATKLAGIAAGATANDTDANLKNRANHTGVQDPSTIQLTATARVLGRTDADAGPAQELSAGAGITIGSGLIRVAADGIVNTLLANMAAATIKGRASGSGTGDPEDLTGAQVAAIIGMLGKVVAWAVVTGGGGTPSIATGGNMASVSRSATGTYDFTFTTDLPNANYGVVAMGGAAGVQAASGRGVSGFTMTNYNSSFALTNLATFYVFAIGVI